MFSMSQSTSPGSAGDHPLDASTESDVAPPTPEAYRRSFGKRRPHKDPRRTPVQKREDGWQSTFSRAPLPDYKPLSDKNLRGYFKSETVRGILLHAGLVDPEGNVLNCSRNSSAIRIIEQEFQKARQAKGRELSLSDEFEEQRAMRRLIQRLLKSAAPSAPSPHLPPLSQPKAATPTLTASKPQAPPRR
eukprot:RCo037591